MESYTFRIPKKLRKKSEKKAGKGKLANWIRNLMEAALNDSSKK